jgi:tetratricopeptide (TPR) repeat protein
LTGRLTETLREAPATIPALGALAVFLAWATDQAGYPVTEWAPGALVVAALLVIALSSVRVRLRAVPVAVRVALACLALYTVLCFLSILWARVPGDAWEGANRTLLYLLVFALFALWPRRGRSAGLLLGAWTLAMIGLAAFVLLHLATGPSLAGFFREGRLRYPAGYENAAAATWGMVIWPALVLAGNRAIHWGLRGLLAAGVVVLADLALLSQSRGSLFATPVMLVLVFAAFPGRLRTFAVLAPIAAAVGVTAPAILLVGHRLQHGGDAHAALRTATIATFALALAVGLLVGLGAFVEGRRTLAEASARRLRTAVGAAALVALVALIAGGWAAAGDPLARVRHGWETFTSGKGYAANASGNRLLSGLGSYRYDFYRVALDEFAAHPLAGIGADNFQQQYLAQGHSSETPRYPHSVELRTLVQTGVIGALLALVGLGAALLAGTARVRAGPARGEDPLASAVAVAALAGFAYWLVHGSFDWFWEFAGLGAPAFALLGLACSLAPARRSEPSRALAGRRVARAAAALAALGAVVSLAAPWLSQLEIEDAARTWPSAPQQAYRGLADAARLNPLSDAPYLVAGSIALRYGDLARADREFSLALSRTPRDAYATLARGAIASARGERSQALALLVSAVRLDPHDPIASRALRLTRAGRRVDISALNRLIVEAAGSFT